MKEKQIKNNKYITLGIILNGVHILLNKFTNTHDFIIGIIVGVALVTLGYGIYISFKGRD